MNLRDYLLQDRQWPRHCRIGHAKLQLSKAMTLHQKQFWQGVMQANQRHQKDNPTHGPGMPFRDDE